MRRKQKLEPDIGRTRNYVLRQSHQDLRTGVERTDTRIARGESSPDQPEVRPGRPGGCRRLSRVFPIFYSPFAADEPAHLPGEGQIPGRNKLIAQALESYALRGQVWPSQRSRVVPAAEAEFSTGRPGLPETRPGTRAARGRTHIVLKRVQGKGQLCATADGSGRLQLFIHGARWAGDPRTFKGWDVGDIVGAEGTLMRTKTGELSVKATALRLLTKSLRPLRTSSTAWPTSNSATASATSTSSSPSASRRQFRLRSAMIRFVRQWLEAPRLHGSGNADDAPHPGGANGATVRDPP